ncbi:MAG: helix-turn-helix domain-containing protein [Propionibacteriales bacterium]|nr:helix-turn-helix domain-containing protein [Propionibacteriales bacterium]
MDDGRTTPKPAALRALSHPVRLRMLGELRITGPSTASRLAARFGLNTGATSYHLRQLAQHGFVVEDEARGNGRDRWWRAATPMTYTSDDSPDPDARAALDAFGQAAVVVYTEILQRAVGERPRLPDAWRRVHALSDWQLRLTPDQARGLRDEITGVLDRWQAADPGPDGAAAAGAMPVTFHLHTFPRPGSVGPTEDQP